MLSSHWKDRELWSKSKWDISPVLVWHCGKPLVLSPMKELKKLDGRGWPRTGAQRKTCLLVGGPLSSQLSPTTVPHGHSRNALKDTYINLVILVTKANINHQQCKRQEGTWVNIYVHVCICLCIHVCVYACACTYVHFLVCLHIKPLVSNHGSFTVMMLYNPNPLSDTSHLTWPLSS